MFLLDPHAVRSNGVERHLPLTSQSDMCKWDISVCGQLSVVLFPKVCQVTFWVNAMQSGSFGG